MPALWSLISMYAVHKCTAIYLDAKVFENRHIFRPKSQIFADFLLVLYRIVHK